MPYKIISYQTVEKSPFVSYATFNQKSRDSLDVTEPWPREGTRRYDECTIMLVGAHQHIRDYPERIKLPPQLKDAEYKNYSSRHLT